MDDLAESVGTEEEAQKFYQMLPSILLKVGLQLVKWVRSRQFLLNRLPEKQEMSAPAQK